jgi:hypothetical protein
MSSTKTLTAKLKQMFLNLINLTAIKQVIGIVGRDVYEVIIAVYVSGFIRF